MYRQPPAGPSERLVALGYYRAMQRRRIIGYSLAAACIWCLLLACWVFWPSIVAIVRSTATQTSLLETSPRLDGSERGSAETRRQFEQSKIRYAWVQMLP